MRALKKSIYLDNFLSKIYLGKKKFISGSIITAFLGRGDELKSIVTYYHIYTDYFFLQKNVLRNTEPGSVGIVLNKF